MELSVIIVSYNTQELTVGCINSVIKNTGNVSYEIIIVDNGSVDGSVPKLKDLIKKFPNLKLKLILNTDNLGFGRANNQGMKVAKGEFLLLLNSDTVIHDNILGEMVGWMDKHSNVGISSCALNNIDGSVQGTGGYFPTLLRVFSWMIIQDLPIVDRLIKPFHPVHHKFGGKGRDFYMKDHELDWVTGAFVLMRKSVYQKTKGFDEDYFMYTEETDLCFRAKKYGWKVVYLPKWKITHIGGASGNVWSNVIPEFEGVKLFYKKHYPKWQYPMLIILLKIGALGRAVLFGIISGKDAFKTYVKAFETA